MSEQYLCCVSARVGSERAVDGASAGCRIPAAPSAEVASGHLRKEPGTEGTPGSSGTLPDICLHFAAGSVCSESSNPGWLQLSPRCQDRALCAVFIEHRGGTALFCPAGAGVCPRGVGMEPQVPPAFPSTALGALILCHTLGSAPLDVCGVME